MNRIVFGCGYLGHRVANLWRQRGDVVHVTSRSDDRCRILASEGYHSIRLDITAPDSMGDLPEADTALIAIGFDRASGLSRDEIYVTGLINILAALKHPPGKVIYVSSTGVYGQSDDSWVDERSPCVPLRDGGRACLAAEGVLRQHDLWSRTIVLRLAGIYGPGRIPHSNRIASDRPIPARPSGYLNLIHVDDAARAVIAAVDQAAPPNTYLVADGTPVRRGEFYGEVASRMGRPAPAFVESAANSSNAQGAAGSKRVSNRKLLQDLEIEFSLKDFRQGLEAIFGVESPESV